MNYQPQHIIFILGRYPELSTLEIKSVLENLGLNFLEIDSQKEYLIISAQSLPIERLQKELGGTVKIGEIYEKFEKPFLQSNLIDYLTSDKLFTKYLTNVESRISFGLSYYLSDSLNPVFSLKDLVGISQNLKNHLNLQGFQSRFPKNSKRQLSSVSVAKNKLLSAGAEILLIESSNFFYLGKTLSAQDFEGFSKRDFGRPLRDMESGTMPPKLARMMLNITKVKKDEAILDPFCGSGTIIQEAMLLGFKDITGTDISKKAIHDTKANISWLQKIVDLNVTPDIKAEDVRSMSLSAKEHFKAIVTEPYMGPNLQERRSIQSIQNLQVELLDLYKNAWKSFFKILRREGIVTMILPVFYLQKKQHFMDLLPFIESLGFEKVLLSSSPRGSLIIGNERDFVQREIVQYKKR